MVHTLLFFLQGLVLPSQDFTMGSVTNFNLPNHPPDAG